MPIERSSRIAHCHAAHGHGCPRRPARRGNVFRGYLYPLFAKSFGIVPGILLTGVLFGLMHGSQLGWTWASSGLLILVGIIFTFARAHTGTVVASFLLHLGYNSMIAVATIVGTHGFTQIPSVNQIRFPSPPPLQCLLWSSAVLRRFSRSSRATSCYIQSAHT